MLLEALVACAGVTLRAVATSISVELTMKQHDAFSCRGQASAIYLEFDFDGESVVKCCQISDTTSNSPEVVALADEPAYLADACQSALERGSGGTGRRTSLRGSQAVF